MWQEVNLCSEIPKKFILRLPAKMILYICAAFFALLLLVFVYNIWQRAAVSREIGKINAQKTVLVKELKLLTQQLVNKEQSSPVKRKISVLSQEVEIKTKLAKAYAHRSAKGFSVYLDVLSNSVVSGTWLTRILIAGGGEQITAVGYAYDMKLITELLKKLNQAEVSNSIFKISKVERSSDEELQKLTGRKDQILHFTLTN